MKRTPIKNTKGSLVVVAVLISTLILFAAPAVAGNGINAKLDWNPREPTVNETVTFNATESTSESGYIIGYDLDIDGDGEFEYQQDTPIFEHTYTEPGEYDVTLRVYNETEHSDTTTATVYVEREDVDADGDGIPDGDDNCPETPNEPQDDRDGDDVGDECDDDVDGDGVFNDSDNCPSASNEAQEDQDGDEIGDECDDDLDGDGVGNVDDDCPKEAGKPDNSGCPVTGPLVSLRMNPSPPVDSYTTVRLNASAKAPTGLRRIRVYLDNSSVKKCTSSPCVANLGTLSSGRHSVSASVTNTSGGTNSSRVVSFKVSGPSVSLSVLQKQPFRENQSVDFAMASSNAPPGSRIRLLVDGVPRATCNRSQCSRKVKLRNRGTTTARAQLVNPNGNVIATASKPLSVLRYGPPSPSAPNMDILPPDITAYPQDRQKGYSETEVNITVNASDPSGVAYIYVRDHNGVRKNVVYCGSAANQFGIRNSTCGTNSTSIERRLDLTDGGLNEYTAVAVDGKGNRAQTSVEVFRVSKDRVSVALSTWHTPKRPTRRDRVRIGAEANSLYNAIDSVSIHVLGTSAGKIAECNPSAYKNLLSCNGTFTPPNKANKLVYFAKVSLPNRTATSNPKTVMITKAGTKGNTTNTPDSDGDGLGNRTERAMCTHVDDPDTVGDALMDGWEVNGRNFSDGHTVNLPGMGANPCRKDVFIEIDWQKGIRRGGWNLSSRALQVYKNAMKGGGITAHVDQGKYGGGNPITSGFTNVSSSYYGERIEYEFVEKKERNFDPHRQGIFHWVISEKGGSAGKYMFNDDVRISTDKNAPMRVRASLLFHEIGHSIGAGHGGVDGNRYQVHSKDMVTYTIGWDNRNYKPNYLSSMNYGYSKYLYWDKAAQNLVWTLDFSRAKLPTLNESDLDERSTAFADALKKYPLPKRAKNSWTPIVNYACRDGNERVIRTATVGMKIKNDTVPWSWPDSQRIEERQKGIDWDCDDKIEASVSQSLDGGDPRGWNSELNWKANRTLVSGDDWKKLPSVSKCPGKQKSMWEINGKKRNKGPTPSDSWMKNGHNPPCIKNPQSHLPSNPKTHKHDLPYLGLPDNTEACDDLDNDGDGEVDEVCQDRDGDGVVDILDNCPDTPNREQVDTDRNYIGNECSVFLDGPKNLSAEVTRNGTVELSWKPVDGAMGYTVYRRSDGNTTYLGSDYPSTNTTTFEDVYADSNASGEVTYWVRPVNQATGDENNRSYVTATVGGGSGLQLPLPSGTVLPLVLAGLVGLIVVGLGVLRMKNR